MIYYDLRTL